MSIDSSKVKKFWESRIARIGKVPLESLANLEERPDLTQIKMEKERSRVLDFIQPSSTDQLLDLGAGIGTWSRFFAKKVSKVTAVEYTKSLIDVATTENSNSGITNIDFVHSPAQDFTSSEKFDIIFISGLFVYLNDNEVDLLMQKIPQYSKESTQIILRDGTGLLNRYEINDKFSENLSANYSAIYRTADTYKKLFKDIGFTCVRDEDMFEEGFLLNKFSETRLRLYLFKRG